jgi:hypothetical protein
MELALFRSGMLLETLVLLFQVAGVGGLVLSRFLSGTAWARRGRRVVLITLVGLAALGSVCNPHSSGMGLYAGGTMTILLVGMISGGSPRRSSDSVVPSEVIERPLPA